MDSVSEAIPDLIAARAREGLSLEQIASSTKISLRYLQAIEDGNIQKLPGAIYTRSYIRQYATAIDYDQYELLDRLRVARVPELGPPVNPKPSGPTRIRRLLSAIFLIPVPR